MKRLQRYVSNELTHFVGRACEDDESRYELLKLILSSGRLEPPHCDTLLHAGDSMNLRGFSLGVSGTGRFSENEVYSTEVVCFCDIPVEDFGVHMRKYSCFGLSFRKSFLVKRDANPVFYIARDAVDRYSSVHGRRLARPRIKRAESFDAFLEAFRNVFNKLFPWVSINGPHRKDVPESLLGVLEEVMMMRSFLDDLFSYFKFFESTQAEASRSNFYMEREWRIRGVLQFQLGDVQRAIFPTAYARRFRRDFPQFFGQITFSD